MSTTQRWEINGADGRTFIVYGPYAESFTRAAHSVALTPKSKCTRAGHFDDEKNLVVDDRPVAPVIDIRSVTR
jgi:hypothetical protein